MNKKLIGGIIVLVVIIASASMFILMRNRADTEPIVKIIAPSEEDLQKIKQKIMDDLAAQKAAKQQLSQETGHRHADGTWHEGEHDTQVVGNSVKEPANPDKDSVQIGQNANLSDLDMSFLDDPEGSIRKYAKIFLEADDPFTDSTASHAYAKIQHIDNLIRTGHYGFGVNSRSHVLLELKEEVLWKPLERRFGYPFQRSATEPKKSTERGGNQ